MEGCWTLGQNYFFLPNTTVARGHKRVPLAAFVANFAVRNNPICREEVHRDVGTNGEMAFLIFVILYV